MIGLQPVGIVAGLGIAVLVTAWLVHDTDQAVAAAATAHSLSGHAQAPLGRFLSGRPLRESVGRPVGLVAAAGPGHVTRPVCDTTRVPGRVGPKSCVAVVAAALRDARRVVRLQAIDAIEAAATPAHARALSDAFTDPDVTLRRLAAAVIASMPIEERVSLVRLALRDGDASVRRIAIDALGPHADENVLHVLYDGLHDRDAGVSTTAADTLADIDDERARVLLRGASVGLERLRKE